MNGILSDLRFGLRMLLRSPGLSAVALITLGRASARTQRCLHWIPAAMIRVGYRYCDGFERSCTVVQLLGRLNSDTSPDDARAEVKALAGQLEASFPQTNKDLSVGLIPARGSFPADQAVHGPTIALLLACVGIVLVIACANVAALLHARGMKRQREVAVRVALGASRPRIVRQFLVESALLGIGGGVIALLVAAWLKDVAGAFFTTDYAGRPLVFSVARDDRRSQPHHEAELNFERRTSNVYLFVKRSPRMRPACIRKPSTFPEGSREISNCHVPLMNVSRASGSSGRGDTAGPL
jgi:hypothetical protein